MFSKSYTVDAYTFRSDVYNYAKIEKATNFYPDWWKKLPAEKFSEGEMKPALNMKGCTGFVNYFRKSFVLPLWSDVRLEIGPIGTENYRYQFSDEASEIDVHNSKEWGDFFSPLEYQQIKFMSPWILRTNRPLEWGWLMPQWNYTGDLREISVLQAVDDYYYQHTTHVSTAIKRDTHTKYINVAMGTPLVHLMPLTEKQVKFKHHLVTPDEYFKIERSSFSRLKFIKPYYHLKKIKEAKSSNKCPFGFGNK